MKAKYLGWKSESMGDVARVVVIIAACLVSGCGSDSGRGAVSGKVTVDGQPLAEGVITFVPAAGTDGPSAGSEVKDGRYSIPAETGPVPGDYRVELRAQKKTGKMIEVGSPEPPGTKIPETVEALPAMYNTKSTLKETIKVGNNPIDFDLKTK